MKKKTSFSSVCEKTNKNGLEVFVARSRVYSLAADPARGAWSDRSAVNGAVAAVLRLPWWCKRPGRRLHGLTPGDRLTCRRFVQRWQLQSAELNWSVRAPSAWKWSLVEVCAKTCTTHRSCWMEARKIPEPQTACAGSQRRCSSPRKLTSFARNS